MNLYEFTSPHDETVYGWGDDEDADAYCYFLDERSKEPGYHWAKVTDPEQIAFHGASAEQIIEATAQSQWPIE